MLKRFTCMILSLVLLVGLIPAVAIQASAASHATSSDAVTILKKLETFRDRCYQKGGIYYIGYGTKCTETGAHGNHTIRENEASAALKEAVKTIDTAINNFASNKGISLTQSQHDALVIFSFENGTGWTKGTDDLQNAVATGMDGEAFWKVLDKWKSGDDTDRRRVEANMYLFGSYVSAISQADFDKKLKDAADADKYDPEDLVNSERAKVTVTNAYLNVREKANIFSAKVGTVYQGEVLRIILDSVQENTGYLWGLYVDEDYEEVGYVALRYTNYDEVLAADEYQQEQEEANTPKKIGTAEVKVNGYVNVRSGAGTKNPIISSLRNGTKVDLYAMQYVNGQRWAKTTVGWFSLAYAKDIDIYSDNADDGKNDYNYQNFKFNKKSDGKRIYGYELTNTPVEIEKATFTTITEVTVRAEAADQLSGARNNILSKGTEFDVIKVKSDNNTVWGYTEDSTGKYVGWVDLSTQYVTRNGAEIKDETEDASEEVELATAKLDVNIRSKADIFGTKVGTLPAGTTVEVLDGPVNGTRMTGWYLLKFTNAKGTESWARGDNLTIFDGTRADITYGKTPTSPDGTQAATGRGMVANTYGGVNVRTAPGTANAKVTKLLPGTVVDILSVTTYGNTKWGQIEQGWVCMDYIAMMDYDDLPDSGSSSSGAVVTTSAIFEGKSNPDVPVYAKPDRSADVVRTLGTNGTTRENVTVHELLTVNEVISDDGVKVTTEKTNWARVNDGYILNPENALTMDALYEETFTVTETDLLKVREDAGADKAREDLDLKKGDQVTVTNVKIVGAQYWGEIEHDDLTGGTGWICLNYCTRGAVSVGGGEGSGNEGSGESGNGGAAVTPTTMSTGNTGVNTYAGKVTGSAQVQEVNVRKEPTTNSAEVTTLKKGTAITITETRLVDGRSWGYCGSGWINLLYVDLTPVGITAIDAKIIAVDNTLVYESSETGAKVVGSYANRAVVHIYSEMNGMYETDMGWISKGNCL